MNEYKEPKTPVVNVPIQHLELVLPIETYRKIMAYAQAAGDNEISGFADVRYNKQKGQLIAGEVYLLDQKVGGADVSMDEETIAKFNLEMVQKGVDQLPRIWWHSHVRMEAFFSGTDEDTSVSLQNESFNISLVVNQHRDMYAKMFIAAEATIKALGETMEEKTWLEIDPLPVRLQIEWEEVPQAIINEVKEKVHTSFWSNLFGGDKDKEETNESKEAKEEVEKKSKHRNKARREKDDHSLEDLHDAYTFDDEVKVFRLSKEKKEAKEKVKELGLKRVWNEIAQEWVWTTKDESQIYVDWWEVLVGWWGY